MDVKLTKESEMETSAIDIIKKFSSPLDFSSPRIGIILAAGHGKRLHSYFPKMLYKIWGIPTVARVSNAIREGLQTTNEIIVLGMKWKEIIETVGKAKNRKFVFQKEQKGTGDAVKTALSVVPENFTGDIYVFPGDTGLIDSDIIRRFREEFEKSSFHMFILTGNYKGDREKNYYGRIIKDGKKVLGIIEYKDIISMKKPMKFGSNVFTKEELLDIKEFNTGIYAFKSKYLRKNIEELKPDNVQNEYYLTDLVRIFSLKGLKIGSKKVEDSSLVLGFNDRTVLKEMNNIARKKIYDRLKEIVTFEDPDDFFISDEVVNNILNLAKNGPVDITIGQGAFLGKGVKLSPKVSIGKHAHLEGNIFLDEGVKIEEEVRMSTYPEQNIRIGKNTEILWGDILRGKINIGKNSRIESWVRITGSDEYPTEIGDEVLIKGNSYIFGCIIENKVEIEYSVLKKKKIHLLKDKEGKVKRIRYIIPPPEGEESMEEIK